MKAQFRIEESWPQVDGGIRYLLSCPEGEVSVDQQVDGKLSGFTRPGFHGDEDAALTAAFNFLRTRQALDAWQK